MSAFKKREKFDIHAKIWDLKLSPRVAEVLEHTRPPVSYTHLRAHET